MDLKAEMERLRKEAELITPKYNIENSIATGENSIVPSQPLPPPVDYEGLLDDEEADSKLVIEVLVASAIGVKFLTDDWVKKRMEMDSTKIARVHQLIKTGQRRLNQASTQCDLMPEDAQWYTVYNASAKEQRENIKLGLSILKDIEKYYIAYAESAGTKAAISEESGEATQIMDMKAINQMIADAQIKRRDEAKAEADKLKKLK